MGEIKHFRKQKCAILVCPFDNLLIKILQGTRQFPHLDSLRSVNISPRANLGGRKLSYVVRVRHTNDANHFKFIHTVKLLAPYKGVQVSYERLIFV